MKPPDLDRLMKAHRIGVDDAKLSFQMVVSDAGFSVEDQTKLLLLLNNIAVLPTRLLTEFGGAVAASEHKAQMAEAFHKGAEAARELIAKKLEGIGGVNAAGYVRGLKDLPGEKK